MFTNICHLLDTIIGGMFKNAGIDLVVTVYGYGGLILFWYIAVDSAFMETLLSEHSGSYICSW